MPAIPAAKLLLEKKLLAKRCEAAELRKMHLEQIHEQEMAAHECQLKGLEIEVKLSSGKSSSKTSHDFRSERGSPSKELENMFGESFAMPGGTLASCEQNMHHASAMSRNDTALETEAIAHDHHWASLSYENASKVARSPSQGDVENALKLSGSIIACLPDSFPVLQIWIL